MTRMGQIAVLLAVLFTAGIADARGGGRGGGGGGRGGGAASRGSARSSVSGSRSASSRQSVNRDTSRSSNRNVNRDVNRNVDVGGHGYHGYGGGYGYGGCCYHPVARAAAVVGTAAVTAAVVGSITYALPSSCSPVIVGGFTYQQCGSTWYQPQLTGTTTEYKVVSPPQ